MIELEGKYNKAKIFTDIVDNPTISQIMTLCNMDVYKDSKIRIMPDCHAGKGCTVGTTMTITDAVTPNLVGVDIGCVDAATEFLTPDGWKSISEYTDGDLVLQYDIKTNKARFTKPLAYIKKRCSVFYHYRYRGNLDMMLSSEHRVLVYDGNDGYNPQVVSPYKLDEMLSSNRNCQIKNSFIINQSGIQASDEELKLMLWVYLFGSLDGDYIRLNLKTDEDKLNRVIDILNQLEIEYNLSNIGGQNVITYENVFEHSISVDWVYKLSYRQCRIIKDEVNFIDNSLNSYDIDYISAVQFVFTSSGYSATINDVSNSKGKNYYYNLHVTNTSYVKLNNPSTMHKSKDGFKYCFSVPSTYFVARRDNLIFVTGNCGMLAVKLQESRIDLPAFDSVVRKFIPSGGSVHESPRVIGPDISSLRCFKDAKIREDLAYCSIGTLGGGNHFIELDRDSSDNIWLVIHTGSRHLGLEVCEYYQKVAYRELKFKINKGNLQTKTAELIEELKSKGRYKDISKEVKKFKQNYRELNPRIPFELAYCTEGLLEDYLHDMEIVQEFASTNREQIAKTLIKQAGLHEVERFETVHNYIDTNNMILRKGSISAELGEKVIIPINMRDGSLICIGKGNLDWNNSAPHGAGRLYSRSDVKSMFTLSEYRDTMKEAGIYTTSVGHGTLDECPMAYKPIESIVDNILDTVDIIDRIKPIYNFKASSMSDD